MGKSKRGGGLFDGIAELFSRGKSAVADGAQATKDVVVNAVPAVKPAVDGDKLSAAVGAPAQGGTNIVGGRRRTRKHRKHAKKTRKNRK
jgi:hypothetical protein